MSSFTEELEVRVLNRTERSRRCVQNLKRFAFEVGWLGSGDLVEVEAGEISDFGSQPRFSWIIDPPFGSCAKSDFIHDSLYRSGVRPRATADGIWLQAMAVEAAALKALGEAYAPSWWRLLRYLVVRAFGWRSYGPRHPSRRPAKSRRGSARGVGLVLSVILSASAWLALVAASIIGAHALRHLLQLP